MKGQPTKRKRSGGRSGGFAPPRPEEAARLLRALELYEKGQLQLDGEPASVNGKPAKREGKHAVHYSTERGDWPTPPDLVDLLVDLFGVIDLDPCSNAASIVPAQVRYSGPPHVDGLVAPWTVKGPGTRVYVNPPYGEGVGHWTARCVEAAQLGCEIVLLLPARTDQPWWHRDVATAQAVGFWRGRLRFLGSKFGAPFPSVLVYWGRSPRRFSEVFGGRCLVWGSQTAGALEGNQLGLWPADA